MTNMLEHPECPPNAGIGSNRSTSRLHVFAAASPPTTPAQKTLSILQFGFYFSNFLPQGIKALLFLSDGQEQVLHSQNYIVQFPLWDQVNVWWMDKDVQTLWKCAKTWCQAPSSVGVGIENHRCEGSDCQDPPEARLP